MKGTSFITLAAVAILTISASPILFSCSEDAIDEQEQPLTKADILRAKAKELAKKYNVGMTLNEGRIDSLAEVLTVEQMERDFQEFANKRIKPVTLETHQAIKPRRVSIRRTVNLTEYTSQRLTGSFSTPTVVLNSYSRTGKGEAIYECGGNGNDHIYANVKVDGYEVEREHLPASFSVYANKVEYFTASGTVTVCTSKYRFSGSLTMYYSKDTGLHVYLNV